MSFQVRCPRCGHRVAIDPARPGEILVCPSCRGLVSPPASAHQELLTDVGWGWVASGLWVLGVGILLHACGIVLGLFFGGSVAPTREASDPGETLLAGLLVGSVGCSLLGRVLCARHTRSGAVGWIRA